MDFNALKAQFEASRRLEVPFGAAKYHLVLPSQHAWRVTLEAHRDPHGRLLETRAFRALLNEAVTGWEGVQQRDIMPEAGEGALPYSAEAAQLLLDCRQDIADALTVALAARLVEQRRAREDGLKNS